MTEAAIIVAIFLSGLGSAILLKRRWGTSVGLLGGLLVSVAFWIAASVAMVASFEIE
ncbi:hypothetical protein KRZ98_03805 [Sphingobium sp. AS12]|uniref:hypothetical protein n=1 Tax=Sphingobium sp. AS12 TaxID=2849495 RepID=UPI001C31561F|nr:hypothetical protein [Sphingobium sp. AS12]MBV2147411.1 hypothetical protein [Sphingobium sp. AS12]